MGFLCQNQQDLTCFWFELYVEGWTDNWEPSAFSPVCNFRQAAKEVHPPSHVPQEARVTDVQGIREWPGDTLLSLDWVWTVLTYMCTSRFPALAVT